MDPRTTPCEYNTFTNPPPADIEAGLPAQNANDVRLSSYNGAIFNAGNRIRNAISEAAYSRNIVLLGAVLTAVGMYYQNTYAFGWGLGGVLGGTLRQCIVNCSNDREKEKEVQYPPQVMNV
jgi:hypothetical protein